MFGSTCALVAEGGRRDVVGGVGGMELGVEKGDRVATMTRRGGVVEVL